jgi:hypothetical protein
LELNPKNSGIRSDDLRSVRLPRIPDVNDPQNACILFSYSVVCTEERAILLFSIWTILKDLNRICGIDYVSTQSILASLAMMSGISSRKKRFASSTRRTPLAAARSHRYPGSDGSLTTTG